MTFSNSTQSPARSGTPPGESTRTTSQTGLLVQYIAVAGSVAGILFVCAILLELLSFLAWSAGHLFRVAQPFQASSPVYSHYDWAAEYWHEESRSSVVRNYVPFRIWGNMPFHGKYLNTDESEMGILRRTIAPPHSCATKEEIHVWVFGGSAVYGIGVPDWETIPSYLSLDFNRGSPKCVIVANLGVEGYVSNQELILLMERLKAVRRPPDIIIFYDGFNDVLAALDSADPAHFHVSLETIRARVQGLVEGRLDFLAKTYTVRLARLIVRHFHAKGPAPSVANLPISAAAILDNYEGNLRLARALAQTYNCKLYDFWQPSLYYGNKALVPFERRVAESKDLASIAGSAVYGEAERRAASDHSFIFLGSLFDDVREPIYVDQVHVGPRGNELAAEAITRYIATDLNKSGQ